jgi:uncharacterized protein involved in type VI secretion and phage assembly
VKYPTLSDQDESAWARVASPGAGPDRGMQVIPEVGDEVLVGFEHDDKRRPVVLAGLWNGTDATPKAKVQGGKVMTRVWVSRNGHTIELDDSDQDKGSITIKHASASSSLHLEKAQSQLQADQQLAIKGNSIEITADTTLKLKARSIEIDADVDVTVKGTQIKLN